MTEALAWGDMPYDCKTPAEVVHDYAVVRGDLSAQYARDQLACWIERYAAEARRAALLEAADDLARKGHRSAVTRLRQRASEVRP